MERWERWGCSEDIGEKVKPRGLCNVQKVEPETQLWWGTGMRRLCNHLRPYWGPGPGCCKGPWLGPWSLCSWSLCQYLWPKWPPKVKWKSVTGTVWMSAMLQGLGEEYMWSQWPELPPEREWVVFSSSVGDRCLSSFYGGWMQVLNGLGPKVKDVRFRKVSISFFLSPSFSPI